MIATLLDPPFSFHPAILSSEWDVTFNVLDKVLRILPMVKNGRVDLLDSNKTGG